MQRVMHGNMTLWHGYQFGMNIKEEQIINEITGYFATFSISPVMGPISQKPSIGVSLN